MATSGAVLGRGAFPCLATPARQSAYRRQLDCYRNADIPVDRLVLEVPYRSVPTRVPVHVFRHGVVRSVLVVCGGVDTWKVELHRIASTAAQVPDLAVAVLDMPGTGESTVPLTSDADEILTGAIEQLAGLVGVRSAAFLGISFGGHWAAKLAANG